MARHGRGRVRLPLRRRSPIRTNFGAPELIVLTGIAFLLVAVAFIPRDRPLPVAVDPPA